MAQRPRLGSHGSAAPLLRLHHRSTDRRLHHDGFASESGYDCATMVVPRQPCRYHCDTRAVLTPLHHHAYAMMASPRRSRLDGVRLVAVEARWLRLHINTMAITPRQRRLDGCGLAIRCRCTRPTMSMIKVLLKQMMSNTKTIATESGD